MKYFAIRKLELGYQCGKKRTTIFEIDALRPGKKTVQKDPFIHFPYSLRPEL